MYGWCGKILRIDLTAGKWEVESPPARVLEAFIGGRGLAGFYLRDRVTLSWDDPAMPLLLFTGPLVGTRSPTAGRMTVMSRSPLTGTIGDASVGGALGTLLKKAGWDGIIIAGRSPAPCGIEIRDHRVRIAAAAEHTGQPLGQTFARLKKGRNSVAVIGPAAENGVRFANIMVDGHHAAGRNGLGLAWAAKNLKYLTVEGTGEARVQDPEGLESARQDILRLVAASPVLSGPFGIARFGTGALYDLIDARGMMPTANFRRGRFSAAPGLNAPAVKARYAPRRAGCRGCPIMCKKRTADGRSLPEFETMSHFSALIENTDLETVVEAGRICNEMGMDTISAASTLAAYAEITGRRVAPAEVPLLLDRIGRQEGIGRDLGQGAARFARQAGRPELAMAVKGQELPAYDPRGALGMALAYAVSSRGGDHLRAYPISHEILRKPVPTDRFSFVGKARMVKIGEDLNAAADSMTACKFVFFAASLEEYARVFQAVTGVAASGQDLFRAGERVVYHERIMNASNGFGREADDLPPRFFQPPEGGDPSAPPPIDREAFLAARAGYYKVRGLDETGRPTAAKARELGLSWDGP